MNHEFRALHVKKRIPDALIGHMESENILAADDLPRYAQKPDGMLELLMNAVQEANGQRKHLVHLTEIWELATARNSAATERFQVHQR